MRKVVAPLLVIAIAACAGPRGFAPAGGPGGPWGDRPPRGQAFLSPMGEPFRAPEPGTDLIGQWFAGADADRNASLSVAEMQADAARFFRLLDVSGDGEIDPVEMTRYENEIAPEVRFAQRMGAGPGGGMSGGRPGRGGRGGPPPGGGMGGGGMGGGGMGRGGGMGGGMGRPEGGPPGGGRGRGPGGGLSLLDIPQPVAAADSNFNRGVTLSEFEHAAGQRFLMLDRDRNGAIARAELVRPGPPGRRR